MKSNMKPLFISTTLMIWLGILTWILFPSLMHRLGLFLIVIEEAPMVDALVIFGIDRQRIQCYKEGQCNKVFVFQSKITSPTWRELIRTKELNYLEKLVFDLGIKKSDISFFFIDRSQENKINYVYQILRHQGIQSALILTEYYKTRRFRFYLDRYQKEAELVLYVQPLNEHFISNLDRWWEHTALANYFLSEYIRIAYYYFKKFFWVDFLTQ